MAFGCEFQIGTPSNQHTVDAVEVLLICGLVTKETVALNGSIRYLRYTLSDMGKHLRNRILMFGDDDGRWNELWSQ